MSARPPSACARGTASCSRTADPLPGVFEQEVRGSHDGGAGIEGDAHRNRGHPLREAPLIGECPHEAPLLERGKDLRGDATTHEDARGRGAAERQVPSLGAEDRAEALERGDAQRMPAGEADLRDRGVRVSLRQLLTEPGGLRHVAAIAQEQVEVLNPLAREDPLVADVRPYAPPQPAQQLDLLSAARCGVRVAPLRCDRVIPPSVPVRSEEHTSELQSLAYLVCRLLLEKKK